MDLLSVNDSTLPASKLLLLYLLDYQCDCVAALCRHTLAVCLGDWQKHIVFKARFEKV